MNLDNLLKLMADDINTSIDKDAWVKYYKYKLIKVLSEDSKKENNSESQLEDDIQIYLQGIVPQNYEQGYDTIIDYHASNLEYLVQVVFPHNISNAVKKKVEAIINYWGHIAYVSTEGVMGITWPLNYMAIIDIDFTKSASDDYLYREPLELLAEFIENGTPMRSQRNMTRKHEGVVRPTYVRTTAV